MLPQLGMIYSLITGSKFLWKVVRNWSVLSKSLYAISDTLKKMHAEGRNIPDMTESQILLMALSNVVKTEVIDIPGVDEYSLSLDIDKFSSSLALSIEDSKSGKYHEVTIKKGVK